MINPHHKTSYVRIRIHADTKKRWQEYAKKEKATLTLLVETGTDLYIEKYPHKKHESKNQHKQT
jgi:hypothetical protein